MSNRSAEEYRDLLKALLPIGPIWTRENESILVSLLYAIGAELSRIDERSSDLLIEQDVRNTDELLTDHELDYGIPEEGDSLYPTTAKRKEELYNALVKVGGQNPAYYIEIANALGYPVDIQQFQPFISGYSTCGGACGPLQNLFYWLVRIDKDLIEESIDVNIKKLILKISKVAPAHTHVLFDFYNCEFSRAFSIAFDRCPHYDNSWLNGEFSRDFDNSFANAYDYDGINYTGSFGQAFSIAFDRYSGGEFDDSFDIAFFHPR